MLDNKYGCILRTPKLEWKNVYFYEQLKSKLKIPILIDTDADAAVHG